MPSAAGDLSFEEWRENGYPSWEKIAKTNQVSEKIIKTNQEPEKTSKTNQELEKIVKTVEVSAPKSKGWRWRWKW